MAFMRETIQVAILTKGQEWVEPIVVQSVSSQSQVSSAQDLEQVLWPVTHLQSRSPTVLDVNMRWVDANPQIPVMQ
jgi:hypothetical protein